MRLAPASDGIWVGRTVSLDPPGTLSACFALVLLAWAVGERAMASVPTESTPVVVAVDARQPIGTNDRFWASAVVHPTEYLDSDRGREHLALLRAGGVTLN